MKTIVKMMDQKIEMLRWMKANRPNHKRYEANMAVYQKHNQKIWKILNDLKKDEV